ncbi:MAG TPA: hypothetical protein VGM44_16505, partial [Polyangiaceae bacterium]
KSKEVAALCLAPTNREHTNSTAQMNAKQAPAEARSTSAGRIRSERRPSNAEHVPGSRKSRAQYKKSPQFTSKSGKYCDQTRAPPALDRGTPALGAMPACVSKVPISATLTIKVTSATVCHFGASGAFGRAFALVWSRSGNGWQAPCYLLSKIQPARLNSLNEEQFMLSEVIVAAPPVLAAGWAFLYLLFGGGIGGALLIFFGLKLIGR